MCCLSCTADFDVDFSKANKSSLVVNGLFELQTFQNCLYVSSSGVSNTGVKSLDISYFINGALQDKSIKSINDNDCLLFNTPTETHSIKFKIITPDGKTIECSDTLNSNSKISEIYYLTRVSSINPNEDIREFNMTIQDDPNEKNYYEVMFLSTNYNRRIDSTVISIYNSIESGNQIIDFEGDQEFEPSTSFFSDELFDGKKINLKIPYVASVSRFQIEKGQTYQNGNYVIIRQISNPYYKYLKSLARHKFNALKKPRYHDFTSITTLFPNDPQNLFTNIKGGLGVFALYKETFTTVPRR